MSFINKVVIVTGASSGIGAATAILFSKNGADVVIVGRNEKKMHNVAEQCTQNGKKPLVIKADVSNDDDAKTIIKTTIETYGKLDVLINNAGFSKAGSLLDGKVLEAYDEVMSTNLRAVIHLTSLAAPYLVKTKGNIINVSSVGGIRTPPVPQLLPYTVSKAGLNHFTRGAALELAPFGVRVNTVSPGPVITDIIENSGLSITWERLQRGTALNRVGESEEIADLIVYLASDKARSITGSNYVSDNGMLLKR